MRALVYENGKLHLRDVPGPKATAKSAIAKVEVASICGTDVRTYINGNDNLPNGIIVGHEFCGTIVEAGNEVEGFELGDRVTVAPAISCGKCYMCKKEKYNMCENLETIGFQYNGCFAEYIEIPSVAFEMNNVNTIADTISAGEASMAEPVACIVNSHSYLHIGKGDTVAVFGSGFIGCMHAELAYRSGADTVIMIEISDTRIAEARKLIGHIETVNPMHEDLEERVRAITSGRGADVVITACSSGKAQEDAQKIAAKCARISLFGGIAGESKGFIDSNLIHYRELSVHGAHASTAAQNRMVLNWIAERSIDIKKYISKIYSLDEILDAFEDAKEQKIIRALITP
jgi:L-iditol 2-dehydrogenase